MRPYRFNAVIHYNVWFSFREGTDEADGLMRVRAFLGDAKARRVITDFALLRNRASPGKTRLSNFHEHAKRTPMLQSLVETILESGLQAVGWAVLKGITLGRYRGFQRKDQLHEGATGLGVVGAIGYWLYRVL